MKIITLVENKSNRGDLIPEHGLSLYIETGCHKILFDAGQSDAIFKNAQTLGIDLSQVDFAVLSHGHYDHGGGMLRFLSVNDHAPIYLSRHCFGPHYNAAQRYIGLDPQLAECNRLRFVEEETEIYDGIHLHCGQNRLPHIPVDPFGLKRLEPSGFIDDDFRHEIYLSIQSEGKNVLFSGCSHRGIVNISQWYPADYCFGGFHFSKLECRGKDRETLEKAAETLLKSPAVFYTGHCTGSAQYDLLRGIMGERLHCISCGVHVEI